MSQMTNFEKLSFGNGGNLQNNFFFKKIAAKPCH